MPRSLSSLHEWVSKTISSDIGTDYRHVRPPAVTSSMEHGGHQDLGGLVSSTGLRSTDVRESIARRSFWLAAILFVGVVELWLAVAGHSYHDLRVYQGALRFWRHHGDLYQYVLPPANHYGFTYPPLTAILLTPLSLLPTRAAATITIAATVAAIIVVVKLVTDRMVWRTSLRRYQIVGVATLLALGLMATRVTLAEGQIDVYVLALVVVDLLVLGGGRWNGVGVGVATAIKLTPAVFIVYLILAGRRRAAAIASATFAACGLLGLALAPHESVEYWTRVLWQTDRVGSAGSGTNVSIRGAFARALTGDATPWWLAAVGLLGIFWWRRVLRARAGGDDIGGLALTGVFVCLISPITWIHHQVLLIPALAVLAGWALQSSASEAVDRRFRAVGWRRGLAALVFVVLVTPANQIAQHGTRAMAVLVGDAYVWVALGLFLFLPRAGDDSRPHAGDDSRPHVRDDSRRPVGSDT
jgi:alpha-1,2-mannosyltransferase